MYTLEIRGQCNVVKGILRQHWSRLTGDEFQGAAGRFEEAMGYAQMRTRKTCRRLKLSRGRTSPDDDAAILTPARPTHPAALFPVTAE